MIIAAVPFLGAALPLGGCAQDCAEWNTRGFHEAASATDTRRCLSTGLDIAVTGKDGNTALHWAARYGNARAVGVLLDAGADIDDTRAGHGNTPLHMAAGGNTVDVVEVLLDAGADIEARNRDGYIPLHSAASTGLAPTVDLLLDAGADARTRTSDGELPVDLARDNPNVKGSNAFRRL